MNMYHKKNIINPKQLPDITLSDAELGVPCEDFPYEEAELEHSIQEWNSMGFQVISVRKSAQETQQQFFVE